jgi:1-acyl-sn-glycerol-3-phosphate acyltransferase
MSDMRGFIRCKLRYLTQPLPALSRVERIVARSFMLVFGHLVRAENRSVLADIPWPVIFVFNHNSYFETICVYLFLLFACGGRKISFIVDWMFAYVPVIGWLLARSEPIYAYRKRARFAWLEKKRKADKRDVVTRCAEVIESGRSIGIYPEGKANADPYRLLKGRTGIGEIVLRTKASVIPSGIDFPARSTNPRIPAIGRMILRFGPILSFSQCDGCRKNHEDAIFVTDVVMRNLALLSGKKYRFPEPVLHTDMTTFYQFAFLQGND